MSDATPPHPQGPPAGDLPPLGGWAGGPPPGALPASPPVASTPQPPTEVPPAWTPPPAEDASGGPGKGALIAAIAAVIAVILLAGGLAIVLADSRDQPRVQATPASTTAAPATTAPDGLGDIIGEDPAPGPSTSAPSSTAPADPDTQTADTEATVDDIVAFIETTRGAKFTTRPEVRFEDDAKFEEDLLADFDEQLDELEQDEVLYHALGLLPADTSLADTLKSALGLGVVGFYDPETDEMVVRGTTLTPYVRTVLAHELTHAFDDQLFNLDRPELDDAADETGYGFTVLTEGSASFVERAYRDQMSPSDQAKASAEELQAGSDPAIFDIPLVILTLLTAPYSQGLELVKSVVDDGGVKAIPDAFGTPPTTSEEAMSPEKYASGEGSVKVPKPKTDGGAEEVDSGVFGQIGFTALLTNGLELDDPAAGTEGWAGDSYTTWTDENDRACVAIDTKLDSAADAGDLAEELDNWAAGAPVEATVTTKGDTVNLNSCATEASSGGAASGV
ncbi:MAG: hypothetical protein R2754_00930 [Microthrixaceae bacterium]